MTDINATIAKHKGYKHPLSLTINDIKQDVNKWWLWPNNGGCVDFVPDYEHDARLYMALYFELPITERINLSFRNKEEFGKEVCLAYMRLHGLECEG